MNLKYILCQINPNSFKLHFGLLLLLTVYRNYSLAHCDAVRREESISLTYSSDHHAVALLRCGTQRRTSLSCSAKSWDLFRSSQGLHCTSGETQVLPSLCFRRQGAQQIGRMVGDNNRNARMPM